MSVPDGASPPQGGPNRGLLVVGIVALAIAVAGIFFAIGRLTAPSDEGAGEAAASSSTTTTAATTTTSTIGVETVGETLEWSLSADIGEIWPVALLDHEGSLYLFGTQSVPFGPGRPVGSGLDGWVEGADGAWAPLGTVIEAPAFVHSVTSTPQGFIALGDSDLPVLWTSSDGREWSASELPTDGASEPGTRVSLSAAGASDDVVVVFGNIRSDPELLIFDQIEAELSQFANFGYSFGGPGGALTVYGPLGIPIYTATAEELGVTEEQLETLHFETGPDRVSVWSSTDGSSWVLSEIDSEHIFSVSTNEDGELVALGFGLFGQEAWTSTDGVVWTEGAEVGEVDAVSPWNDGFVGVDYLGPSAEIVYSEDGEEWTSLGAEDLLPEDRFWSYYPLATGGAGIATVARGFDESEGFVEPEPFVLEQDGYTLTIDQSRGTVVVAEGDNDLLRMFMGAEQTPEEVTVDLEAETVTFHASDTGEALVTLTFDELTEAEQASYGAFEEDERRLFQFSPDGSTWSSQNLDEVVGEDHSIDLMIVGDDRVVGVVAEQVPIGFGEPQIPQVSVWTGLVP